LKLLFALCPLLTACDTEGPAIAAASHGQPLHVTDPQALAQPSAELPSQPIGMPSASDGSLRRGYGPKDIRLGPCGSLTSDRVIKAANCQTGFVVFGPYVSVPANSDVEYYFEVEAITKVSLMTDIVSDMGARFHAAINEQTFDAGTRRWVSYRVHVTEPATQLEGRIHIRADEPASFKINDLVLTVH